MIAPPVAGVVGEGGDVAQGVGDAGQVAVGVVGVSRRGGVGGLARGAGRQDAVGLVVDGEGKLN